MPKTTEAWTVRRAAPAGGSGRLRNLDALRGIAAVAVVHVHYTWGFDHFVHPHVPPVPFGSVYGHLGVELFFVISGFVILMTLERTDSLARFALSRFARLYPAFLVATVVALAVTFLYDNPRQLGTGDVAASLVMASDLLGRKYVDPSYWTLGFEVVFYTLAGITYLRFGVRRVELACLVWLAIGMCSVAVMARHYRLAVLTEGGWSFLFVLGMMVYRVKQGRATALTWLTMAAAVGAAAYVGGQGPSYLSRPETVLVALVFTAAVWAAAEGWLAISFQPLLFLGDISYSLYLVHQVPGLALLKYLEGNGVPSHLAIPATLAAAIAAAAGMRRWVEIPGQRWIRFVAPGSSRRAGQSGGGAALVLTRLDQPES